MTKQSYMQKLIILHAKANNIFTQKTKSEIYDLLYKKCSVSKSLLGKDKGL